MLSFREFLNENSGTSGTTVQPKNKFELIDIIEETIVEEGYIDSKDLVEDMSEDSEEFQKLVHTL